MGIGKYPILEAFMESRQIGLTSHENSNLGLFLKKKKTKINYVAKNEVTYNRIN